MIFNSHEQQKLVCSRFAVPYFFCDESLKVGVSSNLKYGARPIHGMRIQPDLGTTGWFIWVGDLSSEEDFFKPLHTSHLANWAPLVMPYLGLPPGWRFLIAEGYEDVWHDPDLI
jgi:hypothetical protein